jgi:hypothetical protein
VLLYVWSRMTTLIVPDVVNGTGTMYPRGFRPRVRAGTGTGSNICTRGKPGPASHGSRVLWVFSWSVLITQGFTINMYFALQYTILLQLIVLLYILCYVEVSRKACGTWRACWHISNVRLVSRACHVSSVSGPCGRLAHGGRWVHGECVRRVCLARSVWWESGARMAGVSGAGCVAGVAC